MAKRESCYRYLSKDGLEEMNVSFSKIVPTFSYFDDNGIENELKTGTDLKAFYIDDKNADWDPSERDLLISVPVEVGNSSTIYSAGPEQIAYATSEVSIALFVVSPDSADQRLLAFSPLPNSEQPQTINLKGKLYGGQYHGTVQLYIYLVLTKEGTPQYNVLGINNSLGIKLGKICTFKVRITGDGSSFPVFEQASDEKGLWYTQCSWGSIANEQFDETFKLIINPAHPDYQFIDRKSKAYCPRLENEIMAEALADFLLRIKEEAEFVDNPTAPFDDGTVGAIAQYMLETKGIDLNGKRESVLHQIVAAFEKEENR